MNQITFSTPTRKIPEGSSAVVLARFRDRDLNTDIVPSNVAYRIDSEFGCPIADWTSATATATTAITLTAEQNAIRNRLRNIEANVLTVAADRGLSTEYRDTFRFEIKNEPY